MKVQHLTSLAIIKYYVCIVQNNICSCLIDVCDCVMFIPTY